MAGAQGHRGLSPLEFPAVACRGLGLVTTQAARRLYGLKGALGAQVWMGVSSPRPRSQTYGVMSMRLGWITSKGHPSPPVPRIGSQARYNCTARALPWQALLSDASEKPLWQAHWKLPGLLWQTWLQPPFFWLHSLTSGHEERIRGSYPATSLLASW